MKNYLESVKLSTLFHNIEIDEINKILCCFNSSIKSYKKEEIILLAGDKISLLGIVVEGAVQVIKEDYFGNKTILTELCVGEIFGETFCFANIEKAPVTVVGVTNCKVVFIDCHKIFTTCCASCNFHTKLIENMLNLLSNKNIMLNKKIEVLSKRTTREKLMAYFTQIMDKSNSTSFSIPFTRNELADFLCVNRSALSRELCNMQDEGILEFKLNDFTVK
jgi:CRP-like cAMP-binding protein